MNENPDPQLFPQALLRGIWLVLAPSAVGSRLLMDLAARLALGGPLRVLDGGNRFDAFQCSQNLARYLTTGSSQRGSFMETDEASLRERHAPAAGEPEPTRGGGPAPMTARPRSLKEALARITLARAFTCYQMLTLLSETPAIPHQPTLALDLLATFYDESVPAAEALRLLERCLVDLRRLSAQAPVVVSARPPRPGRGFTYGFTPESARPELMEALKAAADEMAAWEAPADRENQLRFL
jgi:hypothetical protein